MYGLIFITYDLQLKTHSAMFCALIDKYAEKGMSSPLHPVFKPFLVQISFLNLVCLLSSPNSIIYFTTKCAKILVHICACMSGAMFKGFMLEYEGGGGGDWY